MKQVNNGFADYYYLSIEGKVYNSNTKRYVKEDKLHRIRLRTKENELKNISLKDLYKMVYNKEFCIDQIEDLENEEWRYVRDSKEKYLVSNKRTREKLLFI